MTLVGLPWAKSFVPRFSRYLDGFEEFPGFEQLPERRFDPARMEAFVARGNSFDLAIQLHGDGSVTNRFLRALRPRLAAGFFPAGQICPDPARFIPYPEGEHEIRRLLKLMYHLGIPLSRENLEFPLTHGDYHEANDLAANGGLRPGQYVCLHAGARDPRRCWPLGNFLEVGRALAARGFRIVLTGTSEEAEQTALLREKLGASCLDLTGKTSLGALGALVKKARLLISNDTGVSHLAVALEAPSVVVFSSSDPRRWAPLDQARHRAVGDPFASPVSHASAAEVLQQALDLLAESPLRLEARDGGFPVLLPVNWNRVKRILLVHEGPEADLVALAPSVAALRVRWDGLALGTSPDSAPAAGLLPGIERLLVPDRLVRLGAVLAVRRFVEQLGAGSFDAAIIFTRPDQNPYAAAYICSLAGIPVRVAASKEFGGALLTHWVRKLPQAPDLEERYLALLRAVALPSQPRGSGLVVPPAVEIRMRARMCEAGINPSQGHVLLDGVAAPYGKADRLADLLRDITAKQVIRDGAFGSLSVVDLAALVQLAGLVITSRRLTTRLAEGFGRPLIATGDAAASPDGWRPRRSRSKLLAGNDVGQNDLIQAVRTLLWIGETTSAPYETKTPNSDVACPRQLPVLPGSL